MDNISRKTQQGKGNRDFVEGNGNLTRKDEDMIKKIIYRERTVQSNTANSRVVTLEELARIVKDQ